MKRGLVHLNPLVLPHLEENYEERPPRSTADRLHTTPERRLTNAQAGTGPRRQLEDFKRQAATRIDETGEENPKEEPIDLRPGGTGCTPALTLRVKPAASVCPG